MPQINASFPKDVIEKVNDIWKSRSHVRSFSEMVLVLVKEAIALSENPKKLKK